MKTEQESAAYGGRLWPEVGSETLRRSPTPPRPDRQRRALPAVLGLLGLGMVVAALILASGGAEPASPRFGAVGPVVTEAPPATAVMSPAFDASGDEDQTIDPPATVGPLHSQLEVGDCGRIKGGAIRWSTDACSPLDDVVVIENVGKLLYPTLSARKVAGRECPRETDYFTSDPLSVVCWVEM